MLWAMHIDGLQTEESPSQASETLLRLQEKVKSCLDKYQHSGKPNLSRQQLKVLLSLGKDDSIVILPVDKGNSMVVMDKSAYQQKILDVLEDETYSPVNKDPTLKLETSINEKLLTLTREGEIDDKLRKRISPKHSYPPQLYGLLKVHKKQCPTPTDCFLLWISQKPWTAVIKELLIQDDSLEGRT